MSTSITIASALAGLNIILLSVLTAVWLRNYRRFRSSLVLGLVAFGAVLIVENAVAIYFFFSMDMLYSGDPGVQTVVLVLRALELIAIAVLTWVTVQ